MFILRVAMAITPIILQSGLSLLLIVSECNVVASLLVYITWSSEDIVQRLCSISHDGTDQMFQVCVHPSRGLVC